MEVELHLMHLQKDFEALNEIVLKNSRQLDELLKQVQSIGRRLERQLSDDGAEVRDLLDEKPPHY